MQPTADTTQHVANAALIRTLVHTSTKQQTHKQAHATDSEARNAAEEASEGLRAARIAEMSTTGSMVTLSSLATMDEDADTLQVCVGERERGVSWLFV